MSFSSMEEELAYWKAEAATLREDLSALRREFDDFQENSHELEQELETSLDQVESKNKDLQAKLQRLEEENDSLKTRLDSQNNESYVTISTLQAEKAELLQVKDSMFRYIRELEQINDDLERGKRVTMSSLDDFDAKLNKAIEKNALLESELDEKEQLSVTCQRLKDEVRDLRSELEIKVKKQNTSDIDEFGPSSKHHASLLNAHASTISVGISTSPQIKATPIGTPLQHPALPQPQPITPSARISALNMVGDLLRKVGALETRLASCRTNISKDSMRHPRTNSPGVESPKVKRMHVNGENIPTGNLTKITV